MLKLNKDQITRDRIIFGDRVTKYIGGVEYFEDMNLETLLKLANNNFINIKDRQGDNYKPIIKFAQFLKFCRDFSECSAELTGYTVDKHRGDYRISIDGCAVHSEYSLSKKVLIEFFKLFHEASEIDITNNRALCWYD